MSFRFYFFFNDTATAEIYTLSLHDALPISEAPYNLPNHRPRRASGPPRGAGTPPLRARDLSREPRRRSGRALRSRPCGAHPRRSEEHTSELQSRQYLVCRLLLEKRISMSAI